MGVSSRPIVLAVSAAFCLLTARDAGADPTNLVAGAPTGVFGEGRNVGGEANAAGDFSFSVPLELPRARGVVQPRISLGYSSAARTGNAGYGWNLHVSSIERSPLAGNPSFQQDPQFERFLHDGQPLAFICRRSECPATAAAEFANFSWAAGGDFLYYRKQLEDGTPARFLLSASHDTWRVQIKGGLEEQYGADDDAREREPRSGGIVRWHLSEESDVRNPNPAARDRVAYRWTKAPGRRGHAFLEHVYYTAPASGSGSDSDWAFHVELSWAQNAMLATSYGSPLRTAPDALLQAIGVSAMPFSAIGSRLVQRIYRLDYTTARSSQGYVSGGRRFTALP